MGVWLEHTPTSPGTSLCKDELIEVIYFCLVDSSCDMKIFLQC